MAGRKPKTTTYSNKDLQNMDREQLQVIRQTLARRTNARMRKLEQTISPLTKQNYAYGAYDTIKHRVNMDGKKRFSIRLVYEGDTTELIDEVTQLQWFLNTPNSTVRGMKEIENERYEIFKRSGLSDKVSASFKDLYSFFNSSTFAKLQAKMLRYRDELYESINDIAEAGYTLTDLEEAIDEWMSSSKELSLKELKSLGKKVVKAKKAADKPQKKTSKRRKRRKGTNTSRTKKSGSKRK